MVYFLPNTKITKWADTSCEVSAQILIAHKSFTGQQYSNTSSSMRVTDG